jgi:putative transcriptional regulator
MTTIIHHPADELLLSYAAGATDEAVSLVVATHLALCPLCRRTVAKAEAIGGAMLEAGAPVPLGGDALESVLARLDDTTPLPATLKPVSGSAARVPEPLRSYIGGGFDSVHWTKITSGIAFKPIMKIGKARVQLIRSKPGHGVGTHTPRGEELTLVLAGGYTDATGHYTSGDLQSTTPEILHRPLADNGEDCIVLAVSDAPLKFQSFAVGLIGKWFGF